MKKIFAIILAAIMMLSLSVIAHAADEIEIPLDADHVGPVGAEIVTLSNGSVTADEIALFDLYLPENVALGDTVVVHIKGSSDSDFRVWLLGDGETDEKGVESTFSNQWKGSENGFNAPGEFEKYIQLTAEDFDNQSLTSANRVAFKGASYGVNLSNTTLTYVGIIYGTIDDVEANAVADAQPYADAAAAALEAANAASDEASLNAALADAEAAVEALTDMNGLGFPGVTALLNDAKAVVREINTKIAAAAAGEAFASIQGDIDTVNNALAAATAAGSDIDAINAALADARTAYDNIQAAADAGNYSDVKTAAKEAKTVLSDIEKLLTAAEEVKAAEEKAAEEAAAKKKQTTTVVVIVVVAVVVIAVIACVVVTALKKKKK